MIPSIAELRKKVAVEHEQLKQKEDTPKASYGYGGKFGVEKDRMDKVCFEHMNILACYLQLHIYSLYYIFWLYKGG